MCLNNIRTWPVLISNIKDILKKVDSLNLGQVYWILDGSLHQF